MMPKRSKSLIGGIALAAFLFLAVIGIVTFIPSVFAENHSHSSVTGYFGLDDDGLPIVNRHGIMLVFDGDIAPETVSVDTFEVSLNDGSFAEIVETRVEGRYVFLRLRNELASEATPIVGIAEGEKVDDLAGNSTNKRKLGFVQIKDGIAPRLTVKLSGGSGIGTGHEGPDRLTKDMIDVRITSDEPLQGAPRVVVVCESLKWTESVDGRDVERDIDDFIANRNGAFPSKPQEPGSTEYTCGYDADGDGMNDPFQLAEDIANSRPGEVWEYTWRNPMGTATALRDGQLAVVVYARDRSRFERAGQTVSNWATSMTDFRLDTEFSAEGLASGIRIYPPNGSRTSERRPFVIIKFPRATNVTLDSVLFDGKEIAEKFDTFEHNRFVYWPLSMNSGEHRVEVEALDAAGNSIKFNFTFESISLGDFILELQPGWNAISVPANPVNRSIDAVFTDPSIQAVISWSEENWYLAVRHEGVWESNPHFSELENIESEHGYWVKSTEFVRQPITLVGQGPPVARPIIGPISDYAYWHFVGVFDRDGDQVEDDFGEPLRDFNGEPITATEYLGSNYVRAYTWDAIAQQFEPLRPEDPMTIGDGVWVYYSPTDR